MLATLAVSSEPSNQKGEAKFSTVTLHGIESTTDTTQINSNSSPKKRRLETVSSEAKMEQRQAVSSEFLPEDICMNVASYLTAKDLVNFECTSTQMSKLNTNMMWMDLCERRWKDWPKHQLTPKKKEEIIKITTTTEKSTLLSSKNISQAVAAERLVDWKNEYRKVEDEVKCTEIELSDLLNLSWYLSFSLSGVRGEIRSPLVRVRFTSDGMLMVPGYLPLPFEIRDRQADNLETSMENPKGTLPFSKKQWIKISDFPSHLITRQKSNAEWMIANQNVTIVSSR